MDHLQRQIDATRQQAKEDFRLIMSALADTRDHMRRVNGSLASAQAGIGHMSSRYDQLCDLFSQANEQNNNNLQSLENRVTALERQLGPA